jgi:hypothetical protein
MELIEVDNRRRITLPKAAQHSVYLVATSPDGTVTLTPAVVRSALEDALRSQSGYIEQLERDAADASSDVRFTDWENPHQA